MANGNFGGGTGTVDDPFLVEDAIDLRNAIDLKYYKQIADIDLSEYDTGEGFTPVLLNTPNTSNARYSYDGNGYKILNLYQNRPSTHEVGMFKIIPIRSKFKSWNLYFDFKNISIINANVTGKSAGVLICGSASTSDDYSNATGTRNYISVENCFVSGQVTSILNGSLTSEYYNTGVIGTIDTNSGKTYSIGTHYLTMTNTVAVLDVNIQISDTPNKTFNFGLLGIKKSPQQGPAMYQRITNSCVHANVTVDKTDDTAIVNIYGVVPENLNNDINNVYVNNSYENVGSKEGVNFFYFTPNSEYTSNMIANHEKGNVNGIDFDNVHYLTDEQMKDLTYYKNLGWTIYE